MDVVLDLHTQSDLQLLILLLVLTYILYFLIFRRINWLKIKVKYIFYSLILINFLFIIIPYISSNDLHSYIFQTRIFGIFKANPYLVPYNNYSFDPIFPYVKTIWSSQTNLHGPLFIIIGAILNILGGNNLNLLTFLFKFTLIGSNILSTFLIYKITNSKKATYLYGLNPLIVFELSANAHADSILILFMLLSFYYLKQKKYKGLLNTFLSSFIKYSTLIFLPFQIVFLKKYGIKKIILTLLLCSIISVLIWLPFFEGPHIFNYLFQYYNGKFISPSLGIPIGEKILNSYALSFKINNIIFLTAYFYLLLKYFLSDQKYPKLLFYCFVIFFIYLLTKLSLVLAWDLTPLTSLACLLLPFKMYKRWGYLTIIFTMFYSLCIYWFVK